MVESAGAKAQAHDPTIQVENSVAALEAALAAAREEAKSQFFVDQVSRMEFKVEKAKAALADAEAALVAAKAEQKGTE